MLIREQQKLFDERELLECWGGLFTELQAKKVNSKTFDFVACSAKITAMFASLRRHPKKKHENKNFQLTHRIAFNEPSTLFVFTSHFDLVFFSIAEKN